MIGRNFIDSSDLYPFAVPINHSHGKYKVGYIKKNSTGFWPSIISWMDSESDYWLSLNSS